MLQPNHRPSFRTESRGPPNEISLTPQNGRATPPPPFRGGPPPPVIIDESRQHMSSHPPLAPMETDRPPHHAARDYPLPRDHARGPNGQQSMLLQHSIPPSDDPRNGGHPHHPQDPYFNRGGGRSRSISPGPHSAGRPRSPPPGFQNYPPPPQQVRQPVGPGQPNPIPPQRSPRVHRREPSHPEVPENGWDRRPPPPSAEHREWDDRRQPRHSNSGEYVQHGAPQTFYPPRSPRAHSPPAPSPRVGYAPRYWDNKPLSNGPYPAYRQSPPPQQPPAHHEQPGRRYDPLVNARESRESGMEHPESRSYPVSPEGMRARQVPSHLAAGSRTSESPHATPLISEAKQSRRTRAREEPHSQSQPPPQIPPQQMPPQMQQQQQQAPPPHFSSQPPQSMGEPAPKKDRRRRHGRRKEDEESMERQPPKVFGAERSTANMPSNFKAGQRGPGSPENSSVSGSSRSIQPSPTSAAPGQPLRPMDEDYDGVAAADVLLGLHNSGNYRAGEGSASGAEGPSHSPTISSHSSRSDALSRPPPSHRNSVSSNHASPPPVQPTPLKRALSPGPEDDANNKRSRMDVMKRRISSPSGGRQTPIPSTRPSPIPFRTQPASHSPEAREPFPPSPSLPAKLPPHPRPIGAGHSQNHNVSSIALPPIATLSPTSTAPSPTNHTERERDDKMNVDNGPRSASPASRGKASHPSSRSPTSKLSQSPPSDKKEGSA